ncbi:MAG TPA: sensor histidine kinase [Candidatus Baltobacteraceae bacterium]|nr:sensor histidine kinase [Candidatus Baltobacteraceae bacterium]
MGELRRHLPILECGLVPYLWLVYAVAVPLSVWDSGTPASVRAYELAGFAIFLTLYVVGYGREGRPALAYAAAIALLAALTAPGDGWAATYYVYAATFVAYAVRAPQAYRIIGVGVAFVTALSWLTHVPRISIAMTVLFSIIAGVSCIAAAEQRRTNVRLRQAHDQIERLAKIAERERIARDLHDVLGHTLSVIALKTQLASKLSEREPERALAEIRDVEAIARTTLDELREAISGYRGAGISDEISRARDVLASAGLRVDCEADDVRLAPAHESVLALAIREAVTNVVRHARAHAVRLRLAAVGDACRFEIEDDGVGASSSEGNGLSGMRERVESHGGSLERRNDGGTRLVVTLPLAPESAR